MCDIMEVITWSLGWCALGLHPSSRHDNKDLDSKRMKLAGKEIGTKAALVEVSGYESL